MARLWKMFGKEPFLVNPHILSINPKRGKKMAKRKGHHRQPAALAAYWATHKRKNSRSRGRRSYKKNSYFMNAPRRNRRGRHNPPAFLTGNKFMGLSIQDGLYAGGGFLLPSTIEGMTLSFLPTALQSGYGRYAVKAGIVFGLSYAAKRFINPEAGRMVAIGGLVYILANAVIDFAPSVFGGFSGPRGFMNPGRATRLLPGVSRQPFLGKYGMGMYGSSANPSLDVTVERMNPEARF